MLLQVIDSAIVQSFGEAQDPQLYCTQLLMNLPQVKVSELSDWLPDQWIAHIS
jgi:hypothetical protein